MCVSTTKDAGAATVTCGPQHPQHPSAALACLVHIRQKQACSQAAKTTVPSQREMQRFGANAVKPELPGGHVCECLGDQDAREAQHGHTTVPVLSPARQEETCTTALSESANSNVAWCRLCTLLKGAGVQQGLQ